MNGPTGTSAPATTAKKAMAVKVYLVFQHLNVSRLGRPNCRVIATRLTRTAAQEIVDSTPGTWIEKQVAVK